jgi:hypothetical protein
MKRVLKTGGQLVVIDLVSPEDVELALTYNQIERLRDPSHTKAHSANALLGMIAETGLVIAQKAERDIEVELTTWLYLTQTPSEASTAIQTRIQAEQDRGERTGMRPFKQDGQQRFLQRWMVVTGIKNS